MDGRGSKVAGSSQSLSTSPYAVLSGERVLAGGEQGGAQRVARSGVHAAARAELDHHRTAVVADDAGFAQVGQQVRVVAVAEERLGVGPDQLARPGAAAR